MSKAALTKRTIDTATAKSREYVIWDDGGKETVKGFGLRISPTGGKTFIFQYRLAPQGKAASTTPRKYTIGKYGPLTPDQARRRAKELAFLVSQGIDPRQQEIEKAEAQESAKRNAQIRKEQEQAQTFKMLSARWLEEYSLDHRASSVGQARVSITKYLAPALDDMVVANISRADVQKAIDNVPATQRATRQQVFAYASIFFRWALERGYTDLTPTTGLTKPKGSKARDRVLSDEELSTVWAATRKLKSPFGAFYRLLILTGQRREEVASMQWSDLDRETVTWTIESSKAKNGVTHIVPLSEPAIEELDALSKESEYHLSTEKGSPNWPNQGPVLTTNGQRSISGFSKAKSALDSKINEAWSRSSPIQPWRVHDLRRTLATGLQRLGTRFEVTEAVLNHVSGARAGVAGIYQRHDWREEKAEALTQWAQWVTSLTVDQ